MPATRKTENETHSLVDHLRNNRVSSTLHRTEVSCRTVAAKQREVSQKAADSDAMNAAIAKSGTIQSRIWSDAVDALKNSGPAERSLLLTSLNEMIGITTTRRVAALSHPPIAVFIMLGLTVITSSGLAGY